MPTFAAIPRTLNAAMRRGDFFSMLVDADVSLEGAAPWVEVTSTTGGAVVGALGAQIFDAPKGQIAVYAMPEAASLPVGTYSVVAGWSRDKGATKRSVLGGYLEIYS